ncbi:hypothetical protein LTR62_001777 [Meristemomyces frigidus]|uniref:Redoxin domain-containing protein n=1 Tax=Meristemomyces frigidus TaxID=1508187 RepID=A0AAN7YI23_9PEZI|nr:hypothetical protein LTR62_001777 [Meristemomyces frigidus]
MSALKAGDQFPSDVKFDWAPIADEDPAACGIPQPYNASEEFKGKKVVLVSVPGAFTPGCHANHVPPYIKNFDKLQQKGVDLVIVIASNDAFVMSTAAHEDQQTAADGWGKVSGAAKGSKVLFMSDTKTKFSEKIGWMAGMGDRNARWAMVIDDGKVTYAEKEGSIGGVTVSGADAVLSKL